MGILDPPPPPEAGRGKGEKEVERQVHDRWTGFCADRPEYSFDLQRSDRIEEYTRSCVNRDKKKTGKLHSIFRLHLLHISVLFTVYSKYQVHLAIIPSVEPSVQFELLKRNKQLYIPAFFLNKQQDEILYCITILWLWRVNH